MLDQVGGNIMIIGIASFVLLSIIVIAVIYYIKTRPVDCQVSDWSQWNTCSATCGGGTQSRTRTIIKDAKNGGKVCPVDLSENRVCNTQSCPVNCAFTDWGDWGACSATCGGGTQTRYRTITTEAANGGIACPTDLSENQTCNTQVCPIDCRVSYPDFPACPVPCGGSTQSVTGQITSPSQNGGTCPSDLTRTQQCNTSPCSTLPGPTAVSTSSESSAGRAWNVFNGLLYQNDTWETANNTYNDGTGNVIIGTTNQPSLNGPNNMKYYGHYIIAEYPTPYVLTSYEFYHRGNGTDIIPATNMASPMNLPKKWFILGSNDNQTWNLVDSVENYTNYTLNTPSVFTVPLSGRTAYSSFALVVNQVNGSIKVNLGEWKLYGYQSSQVTINKVIRRYPSLYIANGNNYIISNQSYGNGTYDISTSSINQTNYSYYMFDSADRFWQSAPTYNTIGTYIGTRTINNNAGEWIRIQLPVQITLYSYVISPEKNNLVRAPTDFILYGSNNNVTWTILDDRRNTRRFTNWTNEPEIFKISNNTTKYNTYLLQIIKTNAINTSANDSVSIRSIELFGYE